MDGRRRTRSARSTAGCATRSRAQRDLPRPAARHRAPPQRAGRARRWCSLLDGPGRGGNPDPEAPAIWYGTGCYPRSVRRTPAGDVRLRPIEHYAWIGFIGVIAGGAVLILTPTPLGFDPNGASQRWLLSSGIGQESAPPCWRRAWPGCWARSSRGTPSRSSTRSRASSEEWVRGGKLALASTAGSSVRPFGPAD